MLHRPAEGLLNQGGLHRLSQVVEGTQLHGCDTVVIVWLPGEDHHLARETQDRKSTRLNSSHGYISYAVFCLKKKKKTNQQKNRANRETLQHPAQQSHL